MLVRISILLVLIQVGFVYLNTINSTSDVDNKVNTKDNPSTGNIDGSIGITKSKDIDPRVKAFLDLIAYAEGTSGKNGYRMQYTGTYFTDMSRHPDEVKCAQAKVHGKTKRLCSTAAGRYQFLTPTFNNLKMRLGLPDFSEVSQDKAAIQLLQNIGVLGLLLKNNPPTTIEVQMAIVKSNRTWASFPGAPYGQSGSKSMNDLLIKYYLYLNRYKGST